MLPPGVSTPGFLLFVLRWLAIDNHEGFAMSSVKFTTALIVGAGSGLSASLARHLSKEGIKVALGGAYASAISNRW